MTILDQCKISRGIIKLWRAKLTGLGNRRGIQSDVRCVDLHISVMSLNPAGEQHFKLIGLLAEH